MAAITVSRSVAAPQGVLFDTMTDLDNADERIEGIQSVDILTEGPIGVGTRWIETRVLFGKEATETMWITEFEPPSHYVVEAESHGTRYRTTLRAIAEGEHASRIELEFVGTPISRLAKLMTPLGFLLMGTVRKCFESDLADIAKAAEASAADASEAAAEEAARDTAEPPRAPTAPVAG